MNRLSESVKSVVAENFLSGGGEIGALMRQHDWSQTPVGPVSGWPQSLRTAVSICLASRFPIVIYWGTEYAVLYNDAYSQILAHKHPWALGRPAREVWSEIWEIIEPMLNDVMTTGQATWSDDLLLLLERQGYPEECYFSFSFSPVRIEGGAIGGVFTAVTETTRRVLGERRLRTLHDLATRSAGAKGVEDACRIAAQTLAENPSDIPFALLYLLDSHHCQARLVGAAGLESGTAASPRVVDLTAPQTDAAAWPLAQVAATGQAELLTELKQKIGILPGGPWPESPNSALVLPVAAPGQDQLAGLLVAGLSPRRVDDSEYRAFFDLIAGHVAAAINYTHAHEVERERAEALVELDRAKTDFFSNVSHEFRTPLTLILGPLEEALNQANAVLPTATREQLGVVHRNGLRLLKLVNTLLDFSRLEAGRIQAVYEPLDLAARTADLASVFRSAVEQAGLRLVVDCPPLPEPVYVDKEMWEKIILNLLSNAFKFTFDGEIAVKLRWAEDQVELEVSDTGTGIPADELPHLFERFHRVRGMRARTHEGSGIGLALVQELVRLHQGTVEASSVIDQGTTFTVKIPTGSSHLPADRVMAERQMNGTPLGAAPFVEEALRWLPEESVVSSQWSVASGQWSQANGCGQVAADRAARILLADDNADMREYLKRLLSDHYTVEAVADGAAALAAAQACAPDLILSDVMMSGLDGFELLRELRADARTKEVPIILLSARAGEESQVEGLQAGADDYLIKPFAARELLARIDANLKMARLRQDAGRREQEYALRLRKLAEAAPKINAALSLDEVLRLVAEQAREIIGAHQAVASLMLGPHGSQAINAVSLSDKYAQDHGGGTLPYSAGIYSVVCQANQPKRMTQAELEAHPSWSGRYSTESSSDLVNPTSTGGWLAAPLIGNEGRNLGLIQLSDKCVGEFTEEDEAILMQLAQLASVAAENARLYHEVQEASRLKDEFLAVVSHELRTPLNALLGWTRILRSSKVDDTTLARALKIIERNAKTQSQLVEDLLDTARIVNGKLRLEIQTIEIKSVIEAALEIVRPAAEAKNITLNVDYDPLLEPILGDPDRLQQVVWNLLSNAIKFTPEGGRVEVKLDIADAKLCLTVSDTGQGISPEFLPYIFDRFRQADATSSRRYGGLGLGLTLVRHLTELHGGTVNAFSAGEGQGTTFVINLPLHATRSEESAAVLAQSNSRDTNSFDRLPSLKGLRVLVVDDEPDTRHLLTAVLTRFGAQVTAVASAVEALTALFAVPAEERPALLISDIMMPGEDGYTLIKQVRDMERIAEQPEAPIPAVALTACSRVEDRMRALSAGFQMHLSKPIEPDELIAVVASLTGRLGRRSGA